jgi:hypothetical protein
LSQHIDLQVLTPLVVGLAVSALVRSRLRREGSVAHSDAANQDDVQVYRGPQGLLGLILFFAIAIPVGLFLLPDSAVQDARPLFNIFAVVAGGLLLWSWVYLKCFKIVLTDGTLTYGAFRPRTIDLNCVTRIRYHRVGNGISLKLFAGKKRVGIFEGSVEHFDAFAKSVRRRIPGDAIAETVGQATF